MSIWKEKYRLDKKQEDILDDMLEKSVETDNRENLAI